MQLHWRRSARLPLATENAPGAIPFYYDSGWRDVTASVGTSSGTLPGGTLYKKFRWIQLGKKVDVYFTYRGTVANSIGTWYWSYTQETVDAPPFASLIPFGSTGNVFSYSGTDSGQSTSAVTQVKIYRPNGDDYQRVYVYTSALNTTDDLFLHFSYVID